jgi:cytochrome c-type biogenesis protein CcmH/NrfG
VVIDPSQRGEKGQQLEAERLARTADFYMNAARFADAHQAAKPLISLKPQESRSFILLGDALAGLNRGQEALDAFRHSMRLLPPSYEEPTLLTERKRAVVESEGRK